MRRTILRILARILGCRLRRRHFYRFQRRSLLAVHLEGINSERRLK